MSLKAPEGVTYDLAWEDTMVCSVLSLVCSCGTNLLEGHTDYIASHDKTIECPKCKSKYRFIWMGMTLKRIPPTTPRPKQKRTS